MSEYQHYEFRAVDKPLTAEQLKRLRALSTRAAISSTSFINTYQWGDFKGNPSRLMEQMFDAFLYWANWGTRRFEVRLPDRLASLERIKPYCVGQFVNVRANGNDLILEFDAEEIDEDYYDDEVDDWMGSLLPMREDLSRGDYRCLYLGWLRSVQKEEVEDDEYEAARARGLTPQVGLLIGVLSLVRDRLRSDRGGLRGERPRAAGARGRGHPEVGEKSDRRGEGCPLVFCRPWASGRHWPRVASPLSCR